MAFERSVRALRELIKGDPDGAGSLLEAVNLLQSRTQSEQVLHQLRQEINRLEWDLADDKITDRTSGMIASGKVDPEGILRYVFRVLGTITEVESATRRIEELKMEADAHKRIGKAKTILQQKHGMTEQEAYLRLQQASRRTRRTIAEIAIEILGAEEMNTRRTA